MPMSLTSFFTASPFFYHFYRQYDVNVCVICLDCRVFTRLLLDLPRIPPVVLDIIRSYCEDEDRVVIGVATLRDLILTRPAIQEQFLAVLLQLTGHQKEAVRIQAIHVCKRLHSKDLLSHEIEVC
jgi:symplekin